MNIDLFSKKFRELKSFSGIELEILSHDSWNTEVKQRRDPVAHRIPLYVLPAILNKEEVELYEQWNKEYIENADAKFEQLSNIGIFRLDFVHHPEQGTIPIYPTIPTDLAHLIRIGNTIEWSLLESQKP